MSHSNRPSHRPDPTIAPIVVDPHTGEVSLREPFSHSTYQEAKQRASTAGRKLARRKARLTKRFKGNR